MSGLDRFIYVFIGCIYLFIYGRSLQCHKSLFVMVTVTLLHYTTLLWIIYIHLLA